MILAKRFLLTIFIQKERPLTGPCEEENSFYLSRLPFPDREVLAEPATLTRFDLRVLPCLIILETC